MFISKTPSFNLKAVLRDTGIAADTLRAWERRYGLPLPERTPGGHRLYSQYDIETIKWLMARQAEGISISHAVDMWKEQVNSNIDPLIAAPPLALNSNREMPALQTGTSLDTLRTQWIAACLEFNEITAEQSLNQAFSMFPVEMVCIDVLQKGLAEIGELWYGNRANVQQEHFASGLAMRRLDSLLNASPAPWRKQTVIIGCPANEWHAFTPLLLSLLLRRRGMNIIHLGVNVPNEQLALTATSVRANLVILVAQTLVTAATLQQTALAMTSQEVRVAFGGRIFNTQPSVVERIPAHFLGNTLIDSLDEVELLLRTKKTAAQVKPIPQEYLAAHQFFTSRRSEIELTLRQMIQPLTISPDNLLSGIIHLGDNITAALQLGDMNYVSGELEWLKTLIRTHEHSTQELVDFLKSYASSVNQHINGSGRPVFEWLSSEVDPAPGLKYKQNQETNSMDIRIVTDSTCDLPEPVVEKHGITVIPLHIQQGGKTYLDGVDMTREEFYQKLPTFTPSPTTAAPGPEIFKQAWDRLAEAGAEAILSIHISEKLSATINSARLAAEQFTRIPVTVLDSSQLSLGMGFIVEKAAQMAELGHKMDEILASLSALMKRTYVFASLKTLEYLRRSGRMHFALARFGELLQIKPLLHMNQGNATAHRVRTQGKATARMMEWLAEYAPYERLAIVHAGVQKEAEEILQRIKEYLPHADIPIVQITPVLGTHLGVGALGFACICKGIQIMKTTDRNALIVFPVLILIGYLVALAGSQGGTTLGGVSIFAIAVGLAFLIQWLAFIPAYLFQTEKFFDLTGSITYISVVGVAVCYSRYSVELDARSVLVAALVIVWALRLGTFLFTRIKKAGKDDRFDELKPSFIRFLNVWTIQGLWVTFTAAAALVAITTDHAQGIGCVCHHRLPRVGLRLHHRSNRRPPKKPFQRDPGK